MPHTMLNDQHWSKLLSIFRNFVEGILYRIRTSCPWRYLPKEFGLYNSIFKKYNRWCKNEKLMKIFKIISSNADVEWVFIKGSHVWEHQHSAGIKDQDISKSIGGNSSKIHLAIDADGNPLEIIISDGTTYDVKIAPKIIKKLDLSNTEVICADKGYDSESLREPILAKETKANIPRKSNTLSNNKHMGWYLYKIRHLVENAFCRLKQFRGIATRYDKLKCSYEGAVALSCIFIWLPLLGKFYT